MLAGGAVAAQTQPLPAAACYRRNSRLCLPPFLPSSGVEVEFPYDAYPCQLAYMEKVVTALQQVGRGRREGEHGQCRRWEAGGGLLGPGGHGWCSGREAGGGGWEVGGGRSWAAQGSCMQRGVMAACCKLHIHEAPFQLAATFLNHP